MEVVRPVRPPPPWLWSALRDFEALRYDILEREITYLRTRVMSDLNVSIMACIYRKAYVEIPLKIPPPDINPWSVVG